MKRLLSFLQQIIDDLLAVLAVCTIRYMHPVRTFGVMLPDELVELAMSLDPLKPLAALLHIAVDAEVGCLASHVLAVAHTANGIVQGQTPIAAAYLNGMSHRLAERLEHLVSQRTEIDDVRLSRLVADAIGLRRGTRRQFLQCEVLADIRRHNLNLRCMDQYPVVLR